MKFADTHTLEILEYNNWIIIKLNKYTPKLRNIGEGLILSDFNKFDVKISPEALSILNKNINKNIDKENPVLEIISNDRIAWLSKTGIIIPPNEIFHIFDIPYHTECENIVDEEVKKTINNQK